MFAILDTLVSFIHTISHTHFPLCFSTFPHHSCTYDISFHQCHSCIYTLINFRGIPLIFMTWKGACGKLGERCMCSVKPGKPGMQGPVCLIFCFVNLKGQSHHLLLVKGSWGEIGNVSVCRFGNGFKQTNMRCSEPSLITKCQLEGRYKMSFLPVLY